MPEPIIIIGAPRSFTSLTAGIFKDHGVWTGKTKDYNACPTGSIENSRMRRLLKSQGNTAANGVVDPIIPDFKEKIKEIMSSEGYEGGAYLFKCMAVYAPSWHEFKPKFICCRRPKNQSQLSLHRVGMFAKDGDLWEQHQDIMDKIVDSGIGVDVCGKDYFKGDWSSLERAFEFCGLEFKQNIAENLTDYKHKHF